VTKYRKEVFREILDYKASLNNIHNVIIKGNFNQDINSSEVQSFFANLEVTDIYSNFNQIDMNRLDYNYRDSTKYIDSIAASNNILQ